MIKFLLRKSTTFLIFSIEINRDNYFSFYFDFVGPTRENCKQTPRDYARRILREITFKLI